MTFYRPKRVLPPGTYRLVANHPLNAAVRGAFNFAQIAPAGVGYVNLVNYATGNIISADNMGASNMSNMIGIGGHGYLGDTNRWCRIATSSSFFWRTTSPIDATIALIRRKTDTTFRVSSAFRCDNPGANGATAINVHLPYADGTVYWDFGNSGRITWAAGGYTAGTNVEYWVFHAGAGGRAIWFNGVKRQSGAATIQHTPQSGDHFALNQSPASASDGDKQEFYQIHICARQWTDGECLSWFNDPWQMYEQVQHRTSAASATSPPPPVRQSLPLLGVGD